MLFGDSSFIIHYLKLVGYRLRNIVQTGSNFGQAQRHDNPFLCEIGTGTMVSDGLAMINITMSSSSFKLGKVKIGEQNYLGNNIFYPAAGRTGANCLLGDKGGDPGTALAARECTGLLGSPCFEIPRVTDRDMAQKAQLDDRTRQERIRAKTRHNIATMLVLLMSYWIYFFMFLVRRLRGAAVFPAAQRVCHLRLLHVHDDRGRSLVRPGRTGEHRVRPAHAKARVDV